MQYKEGVSFIAKREVFHSSPSQEGWKVTSGGKTISTHKTQAEAEGAATAAGRAAHNKGALAQAVLHRSDGTIREERTYGDDPRKTPG
ncbi:DUF2188 domain-containing protein [Rhizobium sp. BR 318]|uniref:DUF2188 domain-containing protein n=2 Tax=Rhizobium/Agrobacterium group TaxID=227290 RepID=A0A7W8XYC4_9HYPH|nr:hypothetical protein [Rhizobium paranaense]